MKIIDRKVEIINPPLYENLLYQVETAGRTCYKSNNMISEGSAEKLISSLIKSGHHSILEFGNIMFKVICDRKDLAQLSRHRLFSFCVSGDTIIPSFSQKKREIRKIYEWYSNPNRKCNFNELILRSVDDNHTIVRNKPLKVFFNGIKPVYLLETESGRKIKTTKNHEFYTDKGWSKLEDLRVGEFVYANGRELLDNEDWLRYNYITLNITRKNIAKIIGCCETYVYQALHKFNIIKPKKYYPNKKPGHGVKGQFSLKQRKEISLRMSGKNNPCYIQDRNRITIGAGYSEANRKIKKEKCEFCNTKKHLEIHHVNKNPKNNDSTNIKVLCVKCHNLWHNQGTLGIFRDKIVEIKYVGEEDVYDIEMEGPFHNYVANGFIVHNCVQSQRYVNYSSNKCNNEITFIRPNGLSSAQLSIWERCCENCENSYMELLYKQAKPELARSVLNNSVMTEMCMSANIREIRHMIDLRSDMHAQDDIRLISNLLLDKLYNLYPVFFKDLYIKFIGGK